MENYNLTNKSEFIKDLQLLTSDEIVNNIKKRNSQIRSVFTIYKAILIVFYYFKKMISNERICQYSLFSYDCNNINIFKLKVWLFIPIINFFWFYYLFTKKIVRKSCSRYFINIFLNSRSLIDFFNILIPSVLSIIFIPIFIALSNLVLLTLLQYIVFLFVYCLMIFIHIYIIPISSYFFYNKKLNLIKNLFFSFSNEYENLEINLKTFSWNKNDVVNYFKKIDKKSLYSPFYYINKYAWFIPFINFIYLGFFMPWSRKSSRTLRYGYNFIVKKIEKSRISPFLKKYKLLPKQSIKNEYKINPVLDYGELYTSNNKSLANYLSNRRAFKFIFLYAIISITIWIATFILSINYIQWSSSANYLLYYIFFLILPLWVFFFAEFLIFLSFIFYILTRNFFIKKIIKENREEKWYQIIKNKCI